MTVIANDAYLRDTCLQRS